MKAKIGMSLLAGLVFTLLFAASAFAAGASFPVAKILEAFKSAHTKTWGQAPENAELVGYRQISPTEVKCYFTFGEKNRRVLEKNAVLLTKPDGTEQWYIYMQVMTYVNKFPEIKYENYFPVE